MDNFIASQYWYAPPGTVPQLSFPRENAALIPYMPAGQTYPLPYEMPQPWLQVQDPGLLFWTYPAHQVIYYYEQPALPSPVYYWNGRLLTFQ